MDNQFRGKHKEPKYRGMKDENTESDKELLDYIYGGYKQDVAKEEAEEVENLRKQASSDMLKAYGFIRRRVSAAKAFFTRLSIGRFKRLVPRNRKLGYALLSVLIVGSGFLVLPGIFNGTDDPTDTLGVQNADASFDTLQPSDDTVGQFDSERGIWGFRHELEGRIVTVTQQELPEELSSETTTLQQLASSLSDKISINRYESDKGQVHIVNLTNTAQRVLFTHENLLVFMESSGPIEDPVWIEFVNSLKLR